MRRILLATAAVAFSSSFTLAADMAAPVYKAPPAVVATVFNWTGLYVGGDIGYGGGRSTGTLNDGVFNAAPVPYSSDPKRDHRRWLCRLQLPDQPVCRRCRSGLAGREPFRFWLWNFWRLSIIR